MKILRLVCIILLVCSNSIMAENSYELFSIERANENNERIKYSMLIPEKVLSKQSKLNILEEEVPLLPGAAAKIAYSKFLTLYKREPFGIDNIWLRKISGTRKEFNNIMYYYVSFEDRFTSPFIVLMDGSVYVETAVNK